MQDIFTKQLLAETLVSEVRKLSRNDQATIVAMRTQFSVRVKPKAAPTMSTADRYTTEEVKTMLEDFRTLGPKRWVLAGADEFVRKPVTIRQVELAAHKLAPEKSKDVSANRSEVMNEKEGPKIATPAPVSQSLVSAPKDQLKLQPPKNFGSPVPDNSQKEVGEQSLLLAKKEQFRERSDMSNPGAQIHNSLTFKSNLNKSGGMEKSTPKENSAIKIVERENYDLDDDSLISRDGGVGQLGKPYLNPKHSAHQHLKYSEKVEKSPKLLSDLNTRPHQQEKLSVTAFGSFGKEKQDSMINQFSNQSLLNMEKSPSFQPLSPAEQATLSSLQAKKQQLTLALSSTQASIRSLKPLLTAAQSASRHPQTPNLISPGAAPPALLSLPSSLHSLSLSVHTLTSSTIPNKRIELSILTSKLNDLSEKKDGLGRKVGELRGVLERAGMANREVGRMVVGAREGLLKTVGAADGVGAGGQGMGQGGQEEVGRVGKDGIGWVRQKAGRELGDRGGNGVRKGCEVVRMGMDGNMLPKGIASLMEEENLLRLKFLTLKQKGIAFENEKLILAIKVVDVDFESKESNITGQFLMRIAVKPDIGVNLNIAVNLSKNHPTTSISQTEFNAEIGLQSYQEFRFKIRTTSFDELISVKLMCEEAASNSNISTREISYFNMPISITWFYPFQPLTPHQYEYLHQRSNGHEMVVVQTEIRQLDHRVAKTASDLKALCPNLRKLDPTSDPSQNMTQIPNEPIPSQPNGSLNANNKPSTLFAGLFFPENESGCLELILDQSSNFYLQIRVHQKHRKQAQQLAAMYLLALSDI